MQEYKVLIIGGGPGGYETAIRLNQYGIDCAVIEMERVGGVCLNWGCIPTKTLVKTAELYSEIKEAESFGLPCVEMLPDYTKIYERKNKIVEQLVSGIEFLFRKRKLPIINEKAIAVSKAGDLWQVDTESGNSYAANYLIIATGSVPKTLPGIEIDEVDILSSTGVLRMDKLPASIAVVGGGVIGCEFASILNTFGVQTHIIEFLPRIVALEDEEVSKRLGMALKKSGIKVMTGTGVTSISKTPEGMQLTLSDGNALTVEKVLMSVGRAPRCDLQWQDANPDTERGAIVIDDLMRTTLPGVYAIGDVTGKMPLAHTASKQGLIVAEHIRAQIEAIDFHHPELVYANIPRCTFTNPEVASVGLTEAEAKDKYTDILIGRFPFTANGKAMSMGETFGFVKTIARADNKQLLGMHIIGPNAAELIAQGAVLIATGSTADSAEAVVFAHPTLSEAIKESIEDIRSLSIHKI